MSSNRLQRRLSSESVGGRLEGRASNDRHSATLAAAAAGHESDTELRPKSSRVLPPVLGTMPRNPAQGRKAGASGIKAMTTWVRIWPGGESGLLQTDKQTLSTLGIQARDFRVIESQTTRQASCILCREKCIIVNMSYIRCIITTQYVLLVPPEDDRSAIFLGKLKERIKQPFAVGSPWAQFLGEAPPNKQASVMSPTAVSGHGNPAAPWQATTTTSAPNLGPLGSLLVRATAGSGASTAAAQSRAREQEQKLSMERQEQERKQKDHLLLQQQQQQQKEEEGVTVDLPFELKALEICLDELASDIDQRTHELEFSLKLNIDGLANSVRTENLDLLRRLKTRLVNLRSVTQTVRGALEELLEDDDDMFNMSLTAKEQRERDLLQRVSYAISEEDEEGYTSDDSHSSQHSVEVSQVEMLLEAYFMHFDSIWDRLQDLMDNVGDTEAVVNIKLDAHQNRLLSVDLVAQFLQLVNYICIGIFGCFTTNLTPSSPLLHAGWSGPGALEGSEPTEYPFALIVVPTVFGCYFIFALVVSFLIYKGTLHIA